MISRKFFTIVFSFLLLINTFAQSKHLQAAKNESFITYKITHTLHEIEATSKESVCIIDADVAKKEIKSVSVQVDVTTFNSGNSNRDSHAMEVIDAIFYPDAKFTSSSISLKGDSLKVFGKLTFHGVTKDITIPTQVKWSDKKIFVSGKFDISLTAFKVERPSLLMIPVKDDLRFTLNQTFAF